MEKLISWTEPKPAPGHTINSLLFYVVLGGHMAETIQQELQRLVDEYLTQNPGKEAYLSDILKVSIPTIRRWREGSTSPTSHMARVLVDFLRSAFNVTGPQS